MASTITEQLGWRWCSKCQGLWYAGSAACPASGCHDHTGSGDYSLAHDLPSSPIRQTDWKWCSKCQVLSFVQHVTGACSGGDLHDTGGSLNYTLDVGTSPGQQNWKWCNKCYGLSFAGNQSLGRCAKGEMHDHKGSGDYRIMNNVDNPHGFPPAGFQNKWSWCNKCQLLWFSGNGANVRCPQGPLAFHDNTGSADYAIRME